MRISDWSSDVCSSDLADPDSLVDTAHNNLDPFAIWKTVMQNEKPGGHAERSVAVGTLDMAVWDALAKIAAVRLSRLLADRSRGGVADYHPGLYAAGRRDYPGYDPPALHARKRRVEGKRG